MTLSIVSCLCYSFNDKNASFSFPLTLTNLKKKVTRYEIARLFDLGKDVKQTQHTPIPDDSLNDFCATHFVIGSQTHELFHVQCRRVDIRHGKFPIPPLPPNVEMLAMYCLSSHWTTCRPGAQKIYSGEKAQKNFREFLS